VVPLGVLRPRCTFHHRPGSSTPSRVGPSQRVSTAAPSAFFEVGVRGTVALAAGAAAAVRTASTLQHAAREAALIVSEGRTETRGRGVWKIGAAGKAGVRHRRRTVTRRGRHARRRRGGRVARRVRNSAGRRVCCDASKIGHLFKFSHYGHRPPMGWV
jgi:hypothetical protein